MCAITAGHNIGRVGTIQSTEKHPGSHNIVHVKDKTGASWATRQVCIILWTAVTAFIAMLPSSSRCGRLHLDVELDTPHRRKVLILDGS